ncbi:hypothetical protein GGR51DRAFT_555964 [Nemania sp. FL0031]|nr:hypothetical protein GGR51DRAFT_555964 [Nemania sp. FL0031]
MLDILDWLHECHDNLDTRQNGGRPNQPLAPLQSDKYSTTSSNVSTTIFKRLLQLEISQFNPLSIVSINRADPRMPRPLKTMLNQLEIFQRGNEVVPKQLAPDVEARRERQRDSGAQAESDDLKSDDDDFYNFSPSVFSREDEAPFWYPIKLDDILDIVTATQMCTTDIHPESSWNMLVHWPIFKLALGTPDTNIPATSARLKTTHTRVACVPCTAARITGRSQRSKIVDFCIALQPDESTSVVMRELRSRNYGSTVNHTDFYPLRDKPIALSARSTELGEDLLEAQAQIGVWQSAQWSLLNSQNQSAMGKPHSTDSISGLPFLPALFIQGSQWYFAATTRLGNRTLLWTQQRIGASDTVLGIFQIIRTLRHLAEWSVTVYWPWYESEVLGMSNDQKPAESILDIENNRVREVQCSLDGGL